ncbi:YihY family inner membrane protein [Luteolibacter yonseiensis]|uniref:YihY family inner membrane protein n=1 Tax=Luteolibacter yonseiensis TaxID=1144680 RepID=A0A934RAH4_9BACT|nr:YhjD/YihY/BrkB family envelope integrity protein [Luteolibacter yonseiensis]MBK1817999.1 YihY family inner membrane protein [Luteolibacter yonseiensis]
MKTPWIGLLKRSLDDWMEDKALRLSAALAYYSIFSIAPLLVITMGIAGLAFGTEAVSGQLYDELRGYVGAQSAAALQSMVQSASKPAQGIWATVAGFVMLMVGASGVFGQLKDALNTIWEVKPKPDIGLMAHFREKLLSFGMVLVIGFLLLVSLVLSAAISGVNHFVGHSLAIPAVVWGMIAFVISLGIVTTLFAMIFKILPDARVGWGDVWVGAIVTGLLFEVGKTALGWYLGRESTSSAYGAAGSVVLLLLWVYYTSCILFFGAEFTQVYAQAGGRLIMPTENARPVTETDRAQQGLGPGTRSPIGRDEPPPPRDVHPDFFQRLTGPFLKYVEARGTLLTIEAREALRHVVTLVVWLAIAIVAIFAGWLLLVTTLVGWLVSYLGWSWVGAAGITGGGHILVAAVAGLMMWGRIAKARWFADTLNELRKDREWLLRKPRQN